jgi:hypothetical protein
VTKIPSNIAYSYRVLVILLVILSDSNKTLNQLTSSSSTEDILPLYRKHKIRIINRLRKERIKASLMLLCIASVFLLTVLPFFTQKFTSCLALSVIPLTDIEIEKEIEQNRARFAELKKMQSSKRSKRKGVVKLMGYSNNKSKMELRLTGFHLDSNSSNWLTDLEKIFKAFSRNKDYKNFGKIKGVFVRGVDVLTGTLKPVHNSSVVLKNSSTFKDYYSKVLPFLVQYWDQFYLDIVCHEFIVTVYNVDTTKDTVYTFNSKGRVVKKSTRSYSTSVNFDDFIEMVDPNPVNIEPKPVTKAKKKPSIKPIKVKNQELKTLATVDIETIIMDKKTGQHIPIAISACSKDFKKLFIVDHNLLKTDSSKAVHLLFKEYLDFMLSLKKDYIIFAHNLGGYDGYFLYKEFITLVKDLDDLSCKLDPSNKFISITMLNLEEEDNLSTLTWKDSLRIFPGSLDSICKQFNVEGKISKYNPEYNTIELFNKPELFEEFKEYSLQDSISLYNALMNAQKLYMDNYQIDICNTVSTASLAFKIFRTHHLTKEIPLLTPFEETFVRNSYLGGATDYYKALGESVYWYDINSLYPYAMLEPVPYKVVTKHNDLSGVNVKDFKGFVYAKVTCPENIKHPIVSLKLETGTVYPRGSWEGVYFADYLAKAQEFGYKIELVSGIEFEYADLFSTYIKHFYEIKRTSKGSLKY